MVMTIIVATAYSFEKSCLSHKFFVTLSSAAVLRQKGRCRMGRCPCDYMSFMFLVFYLIIT